MNNFLKILLACFLAIVIHSIIFFFIIVSIIGGFTSSLVSSETYVVKSNSILRIDLSMNMPDKVSSKALDNFDYSTMSFKQSTTLYDAVAMIEAAADDPRIKGIYINMAPSPMSVSALYELRQAIENFHATSNKFVIAYGEYVTSGGYYLASCADKIYIHPQGGVDWRGVSASVMFYKGLFDKLGVEAQVIRHGEFKGAIEPYVLTKMSPENRLQMDQMVNSLWSEIVTTVSNSRSIDEARLQAIADEHGALRPELAKTEKFVDDIYYMDQLHEEFSRLTDQEEPIFVSLPQYLSANAGIGHGNIRSSDHIAIVYADGGIYDNGDPDKNIIGNNLAAELRRVRKDKKIKGVVLRVNSPGGSQLASDVIWREVNLLKKEKPLVVSMGDYAASGGYYISCAADEIITTPTTITGSIGVFGMMMNFERAAKEKLGLTFDVVKTNPMADMGSMYRPLANSELQILQAEIDSIYRHFVGLVSEGRKLPYDNVDKIAQGRVWTGTQAVELKLTDRIGTLADAVVLAADKAGITDYRIRRFPQPDLSLTSLLSSLTGEGFVKLKSLITNPVETLEEEVIKETIEKYQGIWAKMPYDIVVE